MSGNGATLTNMTASTVMRNSAQGAGGGCAFNGGVSVLAANMFSQNEAGSQGGAIAYTYQCFVAGNNNLKNKNSNNNHNINDDSNGNSNNNKDNNNN